MASASCVSTSSVKKTTIRPKKKAPTVSNEEVINTTMHVPHPIHIPEQPIPILVDDIDADNHHLHHQKEYPSSYCDPKLFTKQQVKRRVTVPFYKIKQGVDVKELLTKELAKRLEGRCSIEGYICPYSLSICNYSCGTLMAGNIVFDILADCLICFPDEHSVIRCVARTITQAGIRAGAMDLRPGCVSPIEVFLSRDMNMKNNELFSRIEENDILTVEIIGRRFVLHDTHVTVIAMLLNAESP
jgi:hypothetical protein